MPVDFFESVPEGGDAYLLSMIMVDYDDEAATRILRNVRRVVPNSGRLVVVEMVVPEPNQPSFTTLADVELMAISNGRMRTRTEIAACFEAADFRLVHVSTSIAPVSVLEGRPV